ncbi:MAG: hypothetical protein JRD04_00190 [Deltaproteobacteria bacterium]|nr:hypothetical protein [Deltaproteobacteria bacterium]
MAIKSLQKRLTLLVLLPVSLVLLFVGIFGFIYVKGILFAEWQDASIVKLQRAAHQIDMKLGRITDWLQMFHRTSEGRGGGIDTSVDTPAVTGHGRGRKRGIEMGNRP